MEAILSILFFVGMMLLLEWVPYRNRMSVPDGCTATPDATILNVKVKPVGSRKTRRLKTVVYFSDSTEYITFKSNYAPRFGYTRLSVDEEVLTKILKDAVIAHDKLCSKTSVA